MLEIFWSRPFLWSFKNDFLIGDNWHSNLWSTMSNKQVVFTRKLFSLLNCSAVPFLRDFIIDLKLSTSILTFWRMLGKLLICIPAWFQIAMIDWTTRVIFTVSHAIEFHSEQYSFITSKPVGNCSSNEWMQSPTR